MKKLLVAVAVLVGVGLWAPGRASAQVFFGFHVPGVSIGVGLPPFVGYYGTPYYAPPVVYRPYYYPPVAVAYGGPFYGGYGYYGARYGYGYHGYGYGHGYGHRGYGHHWH